MSPRAVAEFQDTLGELAARSGEATTKLLAGMSRLSAPEARAFITDAYPAMLDPFLSASASLTTQWYAEQPTIAKSPGAKVFVPQPALLVPGEQLAISGRWALTTPNPTVALQGNATRQVMNASRDTVIVNATNEGVRWIRQAKLNACGFCKMLATRAAKDLKKYSYSSEGIRRDAETGDYITVVIGKRGKTRGKRKAGSKYHDHCVPMGTVVSGPPARGAYRRLYEGEVIVIDTASGQQLTITPNHPVLTDKGWVPAGLINSGDNVIRCTTGEARPVAVPDKYQQPTLIEDVWGSLAVNGLAGVPGSSEQFHGDGRHGEVEIVGAYGPLRDRVESTLYEPTLESILADTGWTGAAVDFSTLGEFASLLPGSSTATHGIMGGGGQSLALAGICPRHANEPGLAPIPGSYTEFNQSATYDNATGVHPLRDFQFGQLLINVESDDFVSVKRDPIARRFDPTGFKFSIENGSTYSSLGLDLLDRLGGQVEMDSVIEARRVSFSGHVLNLETSEGWYSASSLIVSNCRCIAVMLRDNSYDPPEYVQQWTDQYDAIVAKEGTGDLYKISQLMDAGRIRTDRLPTIPDGADDLFAATAAENAPVDLDAPPAEPTAPPRTFDQVQSEFDAAVEAGDDAAIDRLIGELESIQAAEAKAATRRAQAAARREVVDRAKWDEVGSLIEQGVDPFEAESEVFGISMEKIRRREFIKEARADGIQGAGFDELVTRKARIMAREQMRAAEDATNGRMVKRKYAATIDSMQLWTASETQARAWMSDEMAAWFDQNGRITRAALRQSILDGNPVWRSSLGEDFLQ